MWSSFQHHMYLTPKMSPDFQILMTSQSWKKNQGTDGVSDVEEKYRDVLRLCVQLIVLYPCKLI